MNDRPRKPRRSRPGKPGRRPPPPETTGRATELYQVLVDERMPVHVRTTDGAGHRGTIVAFDHDHVTLRTREGVPIEVRIAFGSIRSIEAEGPGG